MNSTVEGSPKFQLTGDVPSVNVWLYTSVEPEALKTNACPADAVYGPPVDTVGIPQILTVIVSEAELPAESVIVRRKT